MKEAIAFETLIERYGEEIYRYLWRMFGDSSQAQDCLQDSYLRAYKAFGRLKADSNERAWLYTIATNTARTALKKRGKQWQSESELYSNLSQENVGVLERIEQKEELADIYIAVMALPIKQRAALMMRKYQEMDYEEIGQALKCTPESARANVYQALRKLRKKFAG